MGFYLVDRQKQLLMSNDEHGRYVTIDSSTTSPYKRDQRIRLIGRDTEVLIYGSTVHQMMSHVMCETSLAMKKAMREHLDFLIQCGR